MGFTEGARVNGAKGRSGFTLIELLIVMVILAIIAGVVVMSIGGTTTTAKERAYEELRQQIQNAVTDYQADHMGALPPATGAINISGNKSIFCICSVTLPGGMLRWAPDGCISIAGGGNDNCDPGNCSGCQPDFHYIWAFDDGGNVFSACVGGDCDANGADGFQGVWP